MKSGARAMKQAGSMGSRWWALQRQRLAFGRRRLSLKKKTYGGSRYWRRKAKAA